MNKEDITLLLVDDNSNNLKLLASVLHPEGYRLSLAKNGVNALKIAKNTLPDLILLDIMMPEMDGFDVCKKLKADPSTRDIPVIFLTAKSDTEDIIKGFQIGGVDYITKPFRKEELVIRVRTHIDLQSKKVELEEQAVELKRSNQIKDLMFSIISHDLRGPIGSMKTMLNILMQKDNTADKFISNAIKNLNKTADNTLILLENLLIWAKSQKQDLEIKEESISAHSQIEDIVTLFHHFITEKAINLELDLSKKYDVKVDKNIFNTILRNLMSNAIKFTPKDGEIKIRSWKKEDRLFISIKDSGIGMSKEVQYNILKEGQMISTAGTNKEKGSGLGLILCNNLIKRSKGELIINSKEGSGTEIIIQLPVA